MYVGSGSSHDYHLSVSVLAKVWGTPDMLCTAHLWGIIQVDFASFSNVVS